MRGGALSHESRYRVTMLAYLIGKIGTLDGGLGDFFAPTIFKL